MAWNGIFAQIVKQRRRKLLDEPFASGDSAVHRIDPRLKIIFATAFSFAVALSNHFPAMAWALVFSFGLVIAARLKAWQVLKRVAAVNGLVVFFWFVVPITFQGEPMFDLGPFTVYRPGVLLAAAITLKSNAILLAFVALVATSSIATLGHAMNRLYVPDKIVHLLLMTYRYVFVIEQEYVRLARAAKIRCFRPKTNIHTYRTYAWFIGMLFVRALARADRVHMAMLCRGFKGRFYSLREFAITRSDWVWVGVMSFFIIILEIVEWIKPI